MGKKGLVKMDRFNNFNTRKEFTDKVHAEMAPNVYKYLNWKLDDGNSRGNEYLKEANIVDGIDYYVENEDGYHRTIQERFRRSNKAGHYNDITLRYQYPENTKKINSEWFKITADYFLYGVVPVEKTSDVTSSVKFTKLVVIDLRCFSRLVDKGKIKIGNGKESYIDKNGILYSGINRNKKRQGDNPSTFVSFNVMDLYKLDAELIVTEHGYKTPKDITNFIV